MGTNYYLTSKPCEYCGRQDEPRHIGKSSAGWCFSLHVYPDEGIETLRDWRILFNVKDAQIENEYGRLVSIDEMIDEITNRKNEHSNWDKPPYGYTSWAALHRENNSEQGPNNLLRHKIDGWHCISHGDGTYDYIVGEFS